MLIPTIIIGSDITTGALTSERLINTLEPFGNKFKNTLSNFMDVIKGLHKQ